MSSKLSRFIAIGLIALLGLNGCALEMDATEGAGEATTEQHVALPAPTGLTATVVSSTQINLAWDPSPGATLYIVYRGFSPGTATSYTTTSAATATFQAKQLQPNTLYCWQVANLNNMNERSARSAEVCATTNVAPTIPAPTGVTATATSDSRITVSWTAVSGALKYYINRSDAGGPFVRVSSVAAPATTYLDAGLMASTTYGYTIQTVMPDGSVSAPSDPVALATTFGLDLEGYWKFNTTSGPALDSSGYGRHGTLAGATYSAIGGPIDERMNRSLAVTSAAGSLASVPHAAPFNLSGSFSVALWVNPQGAGDLSLLGMRAPGCGAIGWELAQVGGALVFRNSQGSVSFGTALAVNRWTHVAVTHNAGTMRLYLDGFEVASGAYTTATFAPQPLHMGHVGGCAGAATLLDEVQIYSRLLSAGEIQVIGERPPVPTSLLVSQRTSTSLQLAWGAVADVQRYVVWRGTTAGGTAWYTSTPPTPSFIADHLEPGTTYYWRVQAVRNNLIGDLSDEASNTTYPAPVPPSNLTATAVSSTRINLAWDPEPRATKYFINESVNGGPFVRKTTATSTTFQVVNLQPNTSYAYTVQTVDTGFLTSAPSAPASATTLP